MFRKKLVIAIDGPAGSGKSSVGEMLAERLGYIHLSTGAIYRAIGWKADKEAIRFDDIPAMTALIQNTEITFRKDGTTNRVLVDGNDVTERLSTNEVGKLASVVSAIPEVRAGVLSLQRQAGENGGVVLDGRDIGTVVFPDADVKFFLDASPQERAKRRLLQLEQQGISSNLEQLIADIKKRDHDDSTRDISPLRKAEDAMYIDSTSLSLEEVVDAMLTKMRKIIDIN
jgi:cytidylate kinase